jgi:hypothetical protein
VVWAVLDYPLFRPLIDDLIATWPNVQAAELYSRYVEIILEPRSWIFIGAGYVTTLILTLSYQVLSYGINARAVLAAIEEGKIKAADETKPA